MKGEVRIGSTRIVAIQGDITLQETDAIVNAANSTLLGGGGVDGAIHRAGGPAILEECKKIIRRIGRLPTGQAVITTGGRLPAKYVIHTVGPVWRGGGQGEPELLASAHRRSLKLANDNGIRTIAFPAISTGAYGYPVEDAAAMAVGAVADAVRAMPFEEVRFVLFSENDWLIYSDAVSKLA
jgi:O-acetyl-ADP-ribose deacetylase (regulator of RNase III)